MKLGGTRQCKAFTVIKILVFWSVAMKPLQDFKQGDQLGNIVTNYEHLGFDCLGTYSVQPAPL